MRSRVSPILASHLKGAPAALLFVVATIVIDPRALADVQSGKAKVEFDIQSVNSAPAPEYRNYSKDELKQSIPRNPVKGISDSITEQVAAVFSHMTNKQATTDHVNATNALLSGQISERDYSWHVATLRQSPDIKKANGEGFRQYVKGQFEESASDRVKDELTLLSSFRQGLSFNLDIKGLFNKLTGSAPAAQTAAPTGGNIRYGLILREINPSSDGIKRAGISDSPEDMLRYAGHADVVWSIGPLEQAAVEAPLFAVPDGSSAAPMTLWERIRTMKFIPSLNFKGSVAPDVATLTKLGKDALPTMRVNFSQADGFYSASERRDLKGKVIEAEHKVRVPIVGELAYGRRYNDKWQVVESSAYNVLVDSKAPRVSLHQMHLDQRYRTEAGHHFAKSRSTVTAGYRQKSPVLTNPADANELYEIKFEKNF